MVGFVTVPNVNLIIMGEVGCGQRSNLVGLASKPKVNLSTLELIEEFGREVRRRREALDMTLEGLSEVCGLTPNYIGTIETGKRDPSLTTVMSLAKGLKVRAGELLGSIPDLSPQAEEMARLFDDTLPEVQRAILKILRTTVSSAREARR